MHYLSKSRCRIIVKGGCKSPCFILCIGNLLAPQIRVHLAAHISYLNDSTLPLSFPILAVGLLFSNDFVLVAYKLVHIVGYRHAKIKILYLSEQ